MSLILQNWNQAQRGEATCSTSHSNEMRPEIDLHLVGSEADALMLHNLIL